MRYRVTVPPTEEQGSYQTTVSPSKYETKAYRGTGLNPYLSKRSTKEWRTQK